ncbi:hypothetical protein SEVIR_8G209600v4 [Setaria viridis]|uniref:AAA+ ATPase domain-containing protein n=1 Tax=Setaria viridis TaxID=4556 RepID=A0A4U6TLF6_SETVI|nr:disease resistance protein RGA5-like isoform X1 [Setaria viridis]XP_034568967.1 disease resistance protein RGA5-like isoform X1 [Setaria viridis]TKW01915.1 hypothetical protein SEVIR_8G209600v2 [Setaria viridis]
MEVVTGALPSVITKLAHLAAGEYNLQKGLNGEIKFLQKELESMKGALEDISKNPPDQLPNGEKIWAGNVRELSYDIEDSIDMFMVQSKGRKLVNQHGLKKAIGRSLDLLMQPKIRRKIANEIREIKSRVIEVHERRRNYKVKIGVDKPVTAASDPRLSTPYLEVKDLVGIDGARDEIIKIMTEREEVPMQQGKIVSIVGFGGLGKTTLAKAVYEKIRAGFDCSAFVSVSENPDSKKLLKGLLYDLGKSINEETLDEMRLINILKEFLQDKRYIIVLDDIWDISVWKLMRGALPDNDAGYRIITTTRNFNVGQQVGGTYKLKPLCLHDSKILLYKRIFSNEDKDECPDEQLAEVSDKILKKCAGVPLAIITIASLLARKGGNIIEWYKVYKSMGTGLENDPDVSNMREILSLGYYDMPSHLRTCLLYSSLFPEDYMINKVRLINMWIAEGFIQCGKQGQSLFDVGESYFNDLINRSMIQPMHDWYSGVVEGCRVHDMVLDLICSFSNEENFVTILNDIENTSSNIIRRLSLQSAKEDHSVTWTTKSLQQVRSVFVFPSALDLMPALESFRVTRVLNLDGCNLSQNYSLKHLGNLFHLRYLGLRGTSIAQLPEKIGNLSFLQTLDVTRNKISSLPPTVVQLRNLMFLYTDWSTRLPSRIGNMACLEYLLLRIDDSTMDSIEEMGQLLELRVLRIVFNNWNNNLVEYLSKLQKIRNLYIEVIDGRRSIGGLDAWVAPQHLCRLNTVRSCWFSALPAWMNRSVLPNLSFLWIAVRELQLKDLEILGRLPTLRSLELEVDHANHGIHGRFDVGAGLFPCLVHCKFWGFVEPVVFRQGAMPRLRELYLDLFFMWEAKETTSSDGGLDMGIRNLPLLQDVFIELRSEVASTEEVEHVKATLRRAAEFHPNHPRLTIL